MPVWPRKMYVVPVSRGLIVGRRFGLSKPGMAVYQVSWQLVYIGLKYDLSEGFNFGGYGRGCAKFGLACEIYFIEF